MGYSASGAPLHLHTLANELMLNLRLDSICDSMGVTRVSQRRKRLEKLQRLGQFSPGELDTLMVNDLGCAATQHGSHRVYRAPDGQKRISVPQHRPHIKTVYLKQIIEMFEAELEALERDESDG